MQVKSEVTFRMAPSKIYKIDFIRFFDNTNGLAASGYFRETRRPKIDTILSISSHALEIVASRF